MSEWTVNIREELGDERIKEICEEELRSAIDYWARNQDNFTTIVQNAIYKSLYEEIDRQINGDIEEMIRDKVKEHIINMPSYDVISSYSHKTEAYKIIEEESKNARPLIKEMVEKHIREYSFHELEQDEIGDVIWEVIMNKILKPREESENE